MPDRNVHHLLSEEKLTGSFGDYFKTECGLVLSPGSKYSNILKGPLSLFAEPCNTSKHCSKCLGGLAKRSKIPVFSTAIVGNRRIPHENTLLEQLESILKEYFLNTREIVSGGAKGADYLGKTLAKSVLDDVSYMEFPADWDSLGKAAGIIRNEPIAKRSHNYILISNKGDIPKGSGSYDVLHRFKAHGKCGLHVGYFPGEGLKVLGIWRPDMEGFATGWYMGFNKN